MPLLPPESFLRGVVIGVIGYSLSTRLARAVVPLIASASFNAKLKSLDNQAVICFYSVFPSTLHALAQILGPPASISLGCSEDHLKDRIAYFDEGSPAMFSGIFVGYLMTDCALCGHKILGPAMTVHHISASFAWWIFAATRSAQWYSCFLQFNELSTPFVNARMVVLTAGYPSSGLEVTVASLAMFTIFGVVRVAPLPKIVYNFVTVDFEAVRNMTGPRLTALFSIFFAVHVCLQTYWFSLMLRKVVRVIYHRGRKKRVKIE